MNSDQPMYMMVGYRKTTMIIGREYTMYSTLERLSIFVVTKITYLDGHLHMRYIYMNVLNVTISEWGKVLAQYGVHVSSRKQPPPALLGGQLSKSWWGLFYCFYLY